MSSNKDLFITEGSRGVGNILTNLLVILIWNIKTKTYSKINLIVGNRPDSINKFCKITNNEHINFITETPSNLNNVETIKHFLKFNYLQRMFRDLSKDFIEAHAKRMYRDPIILFNSIYSKGQLMSGLKYLDIKPNDDLTNKIQTLKSKIGKYISIHIRSTDFITDILKTTPDKISYQRYFNKINELDDNTQVYLATDHFDIQKLFKIKYGDKIVYYEDHSASPITVIGKCKRYTTSESVYVDMFMCVDGEKFYGTSESTFTEFVKILRFKKQYVDV